MTNPSFKLFQHTADMGICASASTYQELLEQAAHGLYAIIGGLSAQEHEEEVVELAFSAADRAALLHDFLSELLFYFSAKSKVLGSVTNVKYTESELALCAIFRPIDQTQSAPVCEVKAITYHGLSITENSTAGGEPYIEACVIVDI